MKPIPRHRWAISDLRVAALSYAGNDWPVVPGHYQGRSGCSCGDADCDTPGGHPLGQYWPGGATVDVQTIIAWWSGEPYSIILPTGDRFDVLDVPGRPGRESLLRLEILGYRLGPVAQAQDGRTLIWVEAGSRLPPPLASAQMYEDLDIRHHDSGDYVVAPPSCGTQWLTAPGVGAWHLPRAATLISTITCACRQEYTSSSVAKLPQQRIGNQLEDRPT
jgi:Bifunctional DNA primase/polymerase, N-terminal